MKPLALAAALLLPLLALFAFVARHDGLTRVRPAVTSGDEPHYLLIVSSLLRDHDLRLDDDYARVLQGGPQAGLGFRFDELDHHTIVLDRRTRDHALWFSLYDWTTHVRCARPCVPFRRVSQRLLPGPDVVEVPAHPLGYPALVALLLAPFSPAPEELEERVADVMALLAWLALVAVAGAALALGFGVREAVGAALLAAVASPWLAYARSYFAEVPIGLALALALWALVARRPALAGLAVVAAAAMKPPFILVGLAWMCFFLLRGRRREALRLAAVVLAGGAALGAFNLWLAGTPFVSGNQGFLPARPGLEGVGVLFFSNTHGLLNFAPWAALSLWCCARSGAREHLRLVAVGALPYLALVAATSSPDGGYCYGPRYLVPLLPWLALAALECRGRARAALVALALAGAVISIPGALRVRHLFDQPAVAALR